MSASETYLVAATTVTAGPTADCTSSKRARIWSGDSTEHPLCTSRAAASPVREEELGMTLRAEISAFDRLDTGRPQGALGRRPEVQPSLDGEVGVEESRNLVAHLVTARTDCRAEDRRLCARPERRDARGDDPFGEPSPTRVQYGERPRAVAPRNRDRQAVRGHGEQRQPRLVAPEPVTRLAPLRRVCMVDRRRVHLPVESQLLRVETEKRRRRCVGSPRRA